MKSISSIGIIYFGTLLLFLQACKSTENRTITVTLPNQEHNLVKTSWPSIGCWFWTAEEFAPGGYKRFIDLHEKRSPFSLLTTSLRYPGELTDPKLHDQIKAGAEYARHKGMGLVMDLDLRLARQQFLERFPEEQQQIVLLREIPLAGSGSVQTTVQSPSFEDHYTFGRSAYIPLKSEVLGMYLYKKEKGLISQGSVAEINNRFTTSGDKDSINIRVDCMAADEGLTACALVAVTVFTPDVFAPHLLSYQREILQQYQDAPLAGACKDEWGFPGRFEPKTNELWYSRYMAEAYARRRPGRELLRDMLLMAFGEAGKEGERVAAINHYMEMYWQRNGEIETDYYKAIKEIFGQQAVSATHPTWYPFPGDKEIFKNGLSWWSAKRDLAQTDESTPFPVRTALSKKMQSPLWYNMYYEDTLLDYHKDLWVAALGGGRLNYHPLWPSEWKTLTTSLLTTNLMRAEKRISLLNYISTAPVDCPVAVVFGHASALNFSNKKGFADVGLDLTNALWKEGYYTDLIPSDEIASGALRINGEGKIQYGPQVYEAVVLYQPEYEHIGLVDFFTKAGASGKTGLYRMGDLNIDFDGHPVNEQFPAAMQVYGDAGATVAAIISALQAKGVSAQVTGEMRTNSGFPASVMPKPSGTIRLIDGTVIQASGEKDVMGDPIQSTIMVNGETVAFDAMGVAAIRLDKNGNVEALAAGGLKKLRAGNFIIELDNRVDLALFKEAGQWRGIIHGIEEEIPAALTRITSNWGRVQLPAQ
ncbi:hypothetical protein [Flavihumibacter fluvii]|uniref:hypothetical protein n=1 Tax=Flavihumibacter fluvii TaxID=2838157 RepID=UPI001BDDF684|nr:hypothetical protein [Flavihumibacter fluvii]ULQ52018.1 hypothetical protein KJS93_18155 [Flavihumibacter fluvii]